MSVGHFYAVDRKDGNPQVLFQLVRVLKKPTVVIRGIQQEKPVASALAAVIQEFTMSDKPFLREPTCAGKQMYRVL